ncbi:MAG: [FeFe] hydrogenase H-cluster maturation GTPase HydF, partial [Oscillospiraceae bacterium]
RMSKTLKLLNRTDLIIYVLSPEGNLNIDILDKKIPYIVVCTKAEMATTATIKILKERYDNISFLRLGDEGDLLEFKQKVIKELEKQKPENNSIIKRIVPKYGKVLMVIPIDGQAPDGRLILPQVQLMRECLDNEICVFLTRETTLKKSVSEIKDIDLVVTDSQIFDYVSKNIPKNLSLTSFSMLLARKNGNFNQLLYGINAIKSLKDDDKILIMEGCTHNRNHEDIARVKIPTKLSKITGKKLKYDFCSGYDFPENIEQYSFAIQCGMCMINKQEIQSRLKIMDEKKVPVTNFGIILAYFAETLERAVEVFKNEKI